MVCLRRSRRGRLLQSPLQNAAAVVYMRVRGAAQMLFAPAPATDPRASDHRPASCAQEPLPVPQGAPEHEQLCEGHPAEDVVAQGPRAADLEVVCRRDGAGRGAASDQHSAAAGQLGEWGELQNAARLCRHRHAHGLLMEAPATRRRVGKGARKTPHECAAECVAVVGLWAAVRAPT